MRQHFSKSYFWDTLDKKYDMSTKSGFSKFDKALETWFRKEHKVTMTDFDVLLREGDPVEANIEIEVPVSDFGLPPDLTPGDFLDLVEGPEADKFDKAGLVYIDDLVDVGYLLSDWTMVLNPADSSKVIITYRFK
jgi:hypothetical protein